MVHTTTLPRPLEDLRALRRAAGLTQVDVAISVGCSPSFVAQVEAGYRPVGSAIVACIRSLLTDDGNQVSTTALNRGVNQHGRKPSQPRIVSHNDEERPATDAPRKKADDTGHDGS